MFIAYTLFRLFFVRFGGKFRGFDFIFGRNLVFCFVFRKFGLLIMFRVVRVVSFIREFRLFAFLRLVFIFRF